MQRHTFIYSFTINIENVNLDNNYFNPKNRKKNRPKLIENCINIRNMMKIKRVYYPICEYMYIYLLFY